MKTLSFICVIALLCLHFSIFAQESKILKTETTKFPEIEFSIYDRNPDKWVKTDLSFSENGKQISGYELKELPSSPKQKQIIFILFENSFWPSYDAQRTYLKKLLNENLNNSVTEDTEIYFTEFDWTDKNGKVVSGERVIKGSVAEILSAVEGIKKPNPDGRLHQFSEVNTALMNALDYLEKIESDSTVSKSILILSSEVSNIYNSQYNQSDIIYSSRKKNIPVYAVKYPRMADKYNLEKVSSETFGLHINADPGKFDLTSNAFQDLLKSIPERSGGNTYNISYKSNIGYGSKSILIELINQKTKQKESLSLVSPSWMSWLFGTVIGILLFFFY